MDRLHDPSLFPLPHPIRSDAALGCMFDTRVFELLGLTAELQPHLKHQILSTEWLLNTLPALQHFAWAHIGLPGNVNLDCLPVTSAVPFPWPTSPLPGPMISKSPTNSPACMNMNSRGPMSGPTPWPRIMRCLPTGNARGG